MINFSKYKRTGIYSFIRKNYKELKQSKYIGKIQIVKNPDEIDIEKEYQEVLFKVEKYIEQMVKGKLGRFSYSSKEETIYGYTYTVMLYGLLGLEFEEEQENYIKDKLLDSQMEDGYFYDKNVFNYAYLVGDGWGMRHLIPHVLVALERLKVRPRYAFRFLEGFYEYKTMYQFLDSMDWSNAWTSSNFVMNIAVCLQYERDFMASSKGDGAIKAIEDWISTNIVQRDIWYRKQNVSKADKYEIVRCAYHLLPILIYDNIEIPYKKEMIDVILSLQNKKGGFDYRKNSSACEDIDAIDTLIRLALLTNGYREKDIKKCIKKAFVWVKQNQMRDGGFVFRKGEVFNYGHKNVSSNINESNLFATWFRMLSIVYMYDYLTDGQHSYVKAPGYEYSLIKSKS